MNDDLIRRSSVKEELKAWAICINHPQFYKVEDADHVIDTIPAVEAVPQAAVEQIKWERDIAIGQLKQHGIPFCGKAPITNGDRIRASNEKLKEWYCKNRDCGRCDFCHSFGCTLNEWLQQAEEEGA